MATYRNVDLSSLKAGLNAMRVELRTKAAFRSAAAGARVVQKKAIENAKAAGLVDSGALIKNIAIARRPVENGGSFFLYNIGVRHGTKKQKKTGNNPWYWWLWEFGWTDKAGQRHKRPFMVPALRESPTLAFAAMQASLARSLARWLKRGG